MRHSRRALGERQREDEVTAPRIVLCPEPAAVRLGESAGDRETKSGANLPGATAPERLEQRLPLLGRQARPVVDDVEAELRRARLGAHEDT